MSGFISLLILCLLMGIGSFLSGLVPLSFTLSKKKISAISALGMGTLVSTALVVIIPEGVQTLYSVTHTFNTISSSISPSTKGGIHIRHGGGDSESGDNGAVVGLALLFGFLLMYMIDMLPNVWINYRHRASVGTNGGFLPISVDISMLRMDRDNTTTRESSETGVVTSDNEPARLARSSSSNMTSASPSSTSTSTSTSTTIGLVIHALADGIALGSAVASDNAALEMMIFLAIIIHKAPASFGLSAVLLRDANLTVNQVKARLATFASAAPLGAIFTYVIILLLSKSGSGGSASQLAIQYWTSVLLLFSGGTFLYVSVHVMQDIQSNESQGGNEHHSHGVRMSGVDFGCSFVGMLLPLLTLLINE